MKTIKLNKNGKARQPRKTKVDAKADQIADIRSFVFDMCKCVKETSKYDLIHFEMLEKLLWKLAR